MFTRATVAGLEVFDDGRHVVCKCAPCDGRRALAPALRVEPGGCPVSGCCLVVGEHRHGDPPLDAGELTFGELLWLLDGRPGGLL